jgi:hypothetical protein
MDYQSKNTLMLPSVLDDKVSEFCKDQLAIRAPASELHLTFWVFSTEKIKNLVKLKFDGYSK